MARSGALLLGVALMLSGSVHAVTGKDRLAGPVSARVIDVVDGDTIRVHARIWLGQELETYVRLSGVDAPELKGHCAAERELALRAREFVLELVGGLEVRLIDIEYGKYAGRVVAKVSTDSGEDVAQALLAGGLARPYDGGARGSWCEDREAKTP